MFQNVTQFTAIIFYNFKQPKKQDYKLSALSVPKLVILFTQTSSTIIFSHHPCAPISLLHL